MKMIAPVTDAAVPAIAPMGCIASDWMSGELLEFNAVSMLTRTNHNQKDGTPLLASDTAT